MTDLTPGTKILIDGKRMEVSSCDAFIQGEWRREPSRFTCFWIRYRQRTYILRGTMAAARVVLACTFRPIAIATGPIHIIPESA